MLKKIWIICILWLPFSLFAVELEGLYSDEIPVQGQSAKERDQAIKKALAAVLIKVSADSYAANSSQFSDAYAQIDRFLLRYRYLALGNELLRDEGYRQVLRVDFDKGAIDQLLSQSGFYVSEGSRFATLVRLTVTKVFSIEDYAAVIHYLQLLSEVIDVQVEKVDYGQVVLKLGVRGDIAGLKDTIDSDGTIAPVNSHYLTGYGVPSDLLEEDAELTYRLIE